MGELPAAGLPDEVVSFVTERHLASLTLVRTDRRPHVTPVGFTFDADAGLVRVITWSGSVKARLLSRQGPLPAAICQVDGGRWITFTGRASVTDDPERCAEGVARYARRYRPPKDRGAERRVIELEVDDVIWRV